MSSPPRFEAGLNQFRASVKVKKASLVKSLRVIPVVRDWLLGRPDVHKAVDFGVWVTT